MIRRIVLVGAAGLTLVVALLLVVTLSAPAQVSAAGGLTPTENLGKKLFFDKNLSLNGNQSCAACHASEVGWTGPSEAINIGGAVYEGSIPGAFGDRKPPAAAYAGDSPILHFDPEEGAWIGGMFWDGRATGERLGDPLAEQAQGPFLNPAEQALPNAQAVVDKVLASDYKDLFLKVCTDQSSYYDCIGRSIAAYERSSKVSAFTSKYDYYLKGKAKCANCHVSEPGPDGTPPLFTDFTYDNVGSPKNPANPVYARNPDFVDPGLGGFLKSAGYSASVYQKEMGKFKVPTLRNVDKRPSDGFVKAYSHNGYFKSLEEIVHFYNTRDVSSAGWPKPEMRKNINKTELGNLGLSSTEEKALVAFLKTLSDGYKP